MVTDSLVGGHQFPPSLKLLYAFGTEEATLRHVQVDPLPRCVNFVLEQKGVFKREEEETEAEA